MLGIGGGPLPVFPLPLLPLFGAGIRNVAACYYCLVWSRPRWHRHTLRVLRTATFK